MITLKGDKKGFSLIEIMIAVAIIAILASILVPNIRRTRINAYETAAIAGLKVIQLTADAYYAANNYEYPDSLAVLADYHNTINSVLNTETGYGRDARGYIFDYSKVSSKSYTCEAWPHIRGVTGNNDYRINEYGILEINRGTGWSPI